MNLFFAIEETASLSPKQANTRIHDSNGIEVKTKISETLSVNTGITQMSNSKHIRERPSFR